MGTAAVVILIKERELVAAFERAGALSAATARSPGDIGADPSDRSWKRLQRRAVVRESRPGMYYFDSEVWRATRRTRQRMVAVIIVLLVIGLTLVASSGAFSPVAK